MSGAYHPEFTLDNLKQLMTDYTLENVMAKAED